MPIVQGWVYNDPMELRLLLGAVLSCWLAGCLVSFDEGLLVDTMSTVDVGPDVVQADLDASPDTRPRDLYVGEGKAPLGVFCTDPAQCESNFCQDEVCCESECQEVCYHCNPEGLCGPTPAGKDYHGDCAKQDPSDCQQDGQCDGAGGCRLYVSGTICHKGCISDSESGVRKCDGKGVCLAPTTTTDCAPFKCNFASGTCYTSCTTSSQCLSPATCKGKTCK